MPDQVLNVANVLKANALVYYSPIGTERPADDIPFEGAWPEGWKRVGFTGAPLRFAYGFETVGLEVQEVLGIIDLSKTSEELSLETTLREVANLHLLPLAWGGSTTDVPADTDQPEVEIYSLGGDSHLTKYQYAFEGYYYNEDQVQMPIRAFLHRATSSAGGELEFGRNDYAGLPFRIRALHDVSKPVGERLVQIVRMKGPRTVAP